MYQWCGRGTGCSKWSDFFSYKAEPPQTATASGQFSSTNQKLQEENLVRYSFLLRLPLAQHTHVLLPCYSPLSTIRRSSCSVFIYTNKPLPSGSIAMITSSKKGFMISLIDSSALLSSLKGMVSPTLHVLQNSEFSLVIGHFGFVHVVNV